MFRKNIILIVTLTIPCKHPIKPKSAVVPRSRKLRPDEFMAKPALKLRGMSGFGLERCLMRAALYEILHLLNQTLHFAVL